MQKKQPKTKKKKRKKKLDFKWKIRSKFRVVFTLTSDPVTSNQRKSSILQLFLRPTNKRKAVKDYVPIIKGATGELQPTGVDEM